MRMKGYRRVLNRDQNIVKKLKYRVKKWVQQDLRNFSKGDRVGQQRALAGNSVQFSRARHGRATGSCSS